MCVARYQAMAKHFRSLRRDWEEHYQRLNAGDSQNMLLDHYYVYLTYELHRIEKQLPASYRSPGENWSE